MSATFGGIGLTGLRSRLRWAGCFLHESGRQDRPAFVGFLQLYDCFAVGFVLRLVVDNSLIDAMLRVMIPWGAGRSSMNAGMVCDSCQIAERVQVVPQVVQHAFPLWRGASLGFLGWRIASERRHTGDFHPRASDESQLVMNVSQNADALGRISTLPEFFIQLHHQGVGRFLQLAARVRC